MRGDNVALRALIAGVEAQTLAIRGLRDGFEEMLVEMRAGFAAITTRLDEFHGEFITHRHGDEGEVV